MNYFFVWNDNSLIYNFYFIVGFFQDDVKFLTTLFNQLTGEETDDNHRRDLVFFLKEFCTFSQTLQQPNRETFYKVQKKCVFNMAPMAPIL